MYHALNSLPVNSVPNEILSIETNDTTIDDSASFSPDFGPVANEDDNVYDSNTDSSSFLPVNDIQQQEIDFIRNNLSQGQMNWPTVGNSPLNEYVTPFLATMAFPTLFPDGKGDPTNHAILKNVTPKEKVKHLIKFAEKRNNNGFIALQIIQGFHTGL